MFSASPVALFSSIFNNRGLIYTSVVRDILQKYKGSFLGVIWSFFNPVLMLTIYTFVFSSILKAKWSSTTNSNSEFALILFAGLIVFNIVSECLMRSPNIIVDNKNYVKKVVFPLEILPVIILISSLYQALISFVVWVVAYIILIGMPHLSVLLFPIVILPLCFFILGCSWFLASLGVFLRDISQVVSLITTALMFLSPIFYSAKNVPEQYVWMFNLNPMTPAVEYVRDVMFWGNDISWCNLFIYLVISMLVAFSGFFWFQKTRKGFADVL